MTRRSAGRARRDARKRENAAAQLMVVGAMISTAHWFLDEGSTVERLLSTVAPLGWVLLAAGLLGTWWSVRSARAAAASHGTADAPASTSFRYASPPRPPDPAGRDGRDARLNDIVAATALSPIPPAPAPAAPTRPTAWSAEVLAQIEWRRFEALVEALFAQAGFQTRAQPHGADGGVDIWLHSRHQPERPASLVQCKHWQARPVGVDKVRELRGVMAAHGVARGQFVTTSRFTPDAQAFAAGNGIRLLDGPGLLALIAERTPGQQQALLAVALEGEYWRPTCASCGVKMVERTGRGSGKDFWGCVNYPRCRTTLEMRGRAA